MGISLSGEEGNTCSPLLCLPPGILDIAHRNKDYWFMDFLGLLWYLSFLIFKMVSMRRRRFYTNFQLKFRILKLLLFLGYMSIRSVLFVFCDLTISDLFAAMLAFFPTGWAPLQIGQVCSVMFRSQGFSESINEFGRACDYINGSDNLHAHCHLSWFLFVSKCQLDQMGLQMLRLIDLSRMFTTLDVDSRLH